MIAPGKCYLSNLIFVGKVIGYLYRGDHKVLHSGGLTGVDLFCQIFNDQEKDFMPQHTLILQNFFFFVMKNLVK